MGINSSSKIKTGQTLDNNTVHNINAVRPMTETKNNFNRENCEMSYSSGFEIISSNNINNILETSNQSHTNQIHPNNFKYQKNTETKPNNFKTPNLQNDSHTQYDFTKLSSATI